MEKLRMAVIGLGHQSLTEHIPCIKASRLAQLHAICDVDLKKLDLWQKDLGVAGYVQYQELLDSEELDFVLVATPHNVYRGVVEQAVRRHIHILKEKPFALNLREAIHFKRLCDENEVHLSTILQRRFSPVHTAFFRLKDQIGTPFFVSATYTLSLDKPSNGWRGKKNMAGGGCILDMGYHMVDILIWYFGLPDKVHAEYSAIAKHGEDHDVEDTASILFSYDDGLHGSLTLSRCYPPKREHIMVIGNMGMIELEKGRIRRLRSDGQVAESLTERDLQAKTANQIDYFCKVIKGEAKNLGSPADHLQHVGFIEACYKSKQEGGYVLPKELLSKVEKRTSY